MRDKTHMESVEKWAHYVRENPDWKQKHTAFIDAQFEKSRKFYERLSKTPAGEEKIAKLRSLKQSNFR